MLFKNLIHVGIPFITIGYGSQYTSRNQSIDKIWYPFGYKWPVNLKVWTPDSLSLKPHRQGVIDIIESHPEMEIVNQFFDDQNNVIPKTSIEKYQREGSKRVQFRIKETLAPVIKLVSVYVVNDHGRFHLGDIQSAYNYAQLGLTDFQNQNRTKTEGQINVAFQKKTKKYFGWSHRAMYGFKLGDKLFEENFGTEYTKYSQHGEVTIVNSEQCKTAASNFARYVS